MRIILSRKGFDAARGRAPSPIFPSGEMRSLPIPQPNPSRLRTLIRYDQITYNGHPLADIVSDLTGERIAPQDAAHLDPDLDAQSLPRQAGWRPMFGQNGPAERHLRRRGVQTGDVFLFFGWFRRVEQIRGRYRYVPAAPDLHVLFGWLQIERRIALQYRSAVPGWAHYHPHYQMSDPRRAGALYLATPTLDVPGVDSGIPGGGVFRRCTPALCLTASGQTRSVWELPGWFYPCAGRAALSYHRNPSRWQRNGTSVLLRTVGRGQEFVLDCDDYPEAIPWLAQMVRLSEVRL